MLESAFTAGFLHDLGKLLLLINLPGTYRELLSLAETKQIPEWQAEQGLFGTTHAEVGGYVLGLLGVAGLYCRGRRLASLSLQERVTDIRCSHCSPCC